MNKNIYTKKQYWKLFLFFLAVIIGLSSILYTNSVVKQLANEERKKIEIWAEATKRLIDEDLPDETSQLLIKIIQNNSTVPVILIDSSQQIITYKNLDSNKVSNPGYLKKELAQMKEFHEPIPIIIPNIVHQYLYYNRSLLLNRLSIYPVLQLGVIVLFIIVAYLAFNSSRKSEQNQVWVGMSKETAHQLGTPTSSLLAWFERLKSKNIDTSITDEFEKDVLRLQKITERFSKIGSKPILKEHKVVETIQNALQYIKKRAPQSVVVKFLHEDINPVVPLNEPLFEWVIENLCKNAMDAMNGQGKISVQITDYNKHVKIDLSDTGKGLLKRKFKTIFKPGYTTKQRGWGLGLSLVKRIIEENHHGKIFVAHSEINKGTTFRIILYKNNGK